MGSSNVTWRRRPLDPTQVRILLSRLAGATSLRGADPEAICESGGMQYNSATSALFRDLRWHLERAWAQHTGIDPFDGDVWQVALRAAQAASGALSAAGRLDPTSLGARDFTHIIDAISGQLRADGSLYSAQQQPAALPVL